MCRVCSLEDELKESKERHSILEEELTTAKKEKVCADDAVSSMLGFLSAHVMFTYVHTTCTVYADYHCLRCVCLCVCVCVCVCVVHHVTVYSLVCFVMYSGSSL